jgi:hypothetical protein
MIRVSNLEFRVCATTLFMQLPKEFTTVTTMSKLLALVIFITFPLFGFLLGMNYQAMLSGGKDHILGPTTPPEQVGCTMDAKICPDGTAVGRMPPSCEFVPCPDSNTQPDVTQTQSIREFGGCHIGGCSGQLCTDQEDAVSTCEYLESYGCYSYTKTICDRQGDGMCGWTQTPELLKCLQNPSEQTTPGTKDSTDTSCMDVYGGMAEATCASVPPTGRACSTDADCTTSCSRGCINVNWTPNTRIMECMAEPMYSCACVNQICIKAK